MEASLAPVSSSAIAAIREQRRLRFEGLALVWIAGEIAEHYGLDFETVADTLSAFPDNLLEFAKSPEGVTAIGFSVINSLAGEPVDYPGLLVSVH